MSGKYALIIGNAEYTDPGLAQLTAPGKDVKEFYRVLVAPEICAFDDVRLLMDEDAWKVREAIENFLSDKKPDDMLVLYFSGHGVRDEAGDLYLAVRNTSRARLLSTAIESDFIREAMDKSRSRRQVLILDCCNSGAFARGTKAGAALGGAMGLVSTLQGYGRFVLTASDATQFAWEGNKVIGQDTENSLFTHFLVKGLEGAADRDGDGRISIDELYDYAFDNVVSITPKQTPGKSASNQQGEIILRENIPLEDAKPSPLPPELLQAIENPIPDVREGAVRGLETMLNGKNVGLARSAQLALENLAARDDSRQVAEAAAAALKSGPGRSREVSQNPIAPPVDRMTRKFPWLLEEWSRIRTFLGGARAKPAGILSVAVLVVLLAGFAISRFLTQPSVPAATPTSGAIHTPSGGIPTVAAEQVVAQLQTEPGPTGTLPATATTPTEAATSTATPDPAERTDARGVVMVLVPAGDFQMGAARGDAAQYSDETPRHTVELDGYYIDKFEVTNALYQACVEAGACSRPKIDRSGNRAGTTYYGNREYDNYPVIYVDWEMAKTLCEWREARLPTEAEWEKAASWDDEARKKRIYPWGDQLPADGEANYRFKYSEQDTSPVGFYESGVSPYGIYDMAGNVWEWVADLYSENYYSTSPGRNPLGPDAGGFHVVRGGSFDEKEEELRTSNRRQLTARAYDRDVGFRCASSLP